MDVLAQHFTQLRVDDVLERFERRLECAHFGVVEPAEPLRPATLIRQASRG